MRGDLLNTLSQLNLVACLWGTIGGFGSFFSFLVTPLLRGLNRLSIFIGFFSISALILILDHFHSSLKSTKSRVLLNIFLSIMFITALFDQTSSNFIPRYEAIKSEYTSDRQFIERIESLIPQKSLILQLPYVPFPEAGFWNKMHDYDHLRGYLHSKQLLWSYGAMKGRDADLWQEELSRQTLPKALETISLANFQGIYMDRFGYKDNGAAIEQGLRELLGPPAVVSANNRLLFFDLRDFNGRRRQQLDAKELQLQQELALHPLFLYWRNGFYGLEKGESLTWRWCSGNGILYISNPSPHPKIAMIEAYFTPISKGHSNVQITGDLLSTKISLAGDTHTKLLKEVTIKPGVSKILFSCDAIKRSTAQDPRMFSFAIINFKVTCQEARTITSRL
jgi:phosphoglycerol transferase